MFQLKITLLLVIKPITYSESFLNKLDLKILNYLSQTNLYNYTSSKKFFTLSTFKF